MHPTGAAILRGRETRKVANNTYARKDGESVVIRLHNTDVVTIHDDGSRTLNSGGYWTATTKQRLCLYGAPVFHRKGDWFVQRDGYAEPFYDGITIPANEIVNW